MKPWNLYHQSGVALGDHLCIKVSFFTLGNVEIVGSNISVDRFFMSFDPALVETGNSFGEEISVGE